jgi:hypothetical protein
MICPRCGHKWWQRALPNFVQCPRCHRMVRIQVVYDGTDISEIKAVVNKP